MLCSSSVFRERTKFDARQFDIVTSRYIYFALLVLLATRNVVRTQKESKLAKLGIGKNGRYRYTTTLSLGDVECSAEGTTGTGGRRRPHLRRGHKKSQRYGPGLQFTKTILIPPVFVNAADGMIVDRSHYNVKKGARREEEEAAEAPALPST